MSVRSTTGSLALRALAALLLFIGFYVLALAIAGGLLALVYWTTTHVRRIPLKLILLAVVAAATILWSLLPRADEFEPPGPQLRPEDAPRLFEVLEEVARAAGQSMPCEVYLEFDVNAWVSSRGGVMGIGSRRIMGLGLPLLQQLNVAQLRAVLAHEFGHYHGGDVMLGSWLYQTRAAIGRTVQAFRESDSAVLHLPFELYGDLFLRVTHGISRHQEFQADALAAKLVGSRPLIEGLQAVHRGAVVNQVYLESEVLPVLRAGFRPPIASGFAHFVASPTIAPKIEESLEQALQDDLADPHDTHPPLPVRIAALRDLPEGPPPADGDERLAIELLGDLDATERAMVLHARPALDLREPEPISWDQVGETVMAEHAREVARALEEPLRGLTVGTIPIEQEDLATWARSTGRGSFDATRVDLARDAISILSLVLALRLHEAGWTLEALPGEPVAAARDGQRFVPATWLRGLSAGKLDAAAWREECGRLGILDVVLAPEPEA